VKRSVAVAVLPLAVSHANGSEWRAMESSRAVMIAVIIGVLVAAGWLWRDDRLCRREIRHQFGDVEKIHHPLASDLYEFVPPSWKAAWHSGMPYPFAVDCWTDLSGVSGFERR